MSTPDIVEIPPPPADLRDAFILRLGVAAIFLLTPLGALHWGYRFVGEAWLLPLGLGPFWMYAACVMEVGCAALYVLRRPGPWISAFLLGLVAFYTGILIFTDPSLLHHPLGVLSKNVPILAATFAAFGLYRPSLVETSRIVLWLGFGFLWIYEGLMPKILFPSAIELGWMEQVGWSPIPEPLALICIGAFEILIGLLVLLPGVPLAVRRGALMTVIVLMLLLPIPVAWFDPAFLYHPFMPLAKNLPAIAVAVVLLRHTGRGLGPLVKPYFWSVPATGPSAFTRLSSRGGRVGHDFFAREGLIDPDRQATGLLDAVEELRSASFDPGALHPEVQRFYERTTDYLMRVEGHWHGLFAYGAPLFRRLYSRPVGQFGLPLAGDPDALLDTAVMPLREERDGRPSPRGWVRVQHALDLTVYAAAYSKLRTAEHTMMSVAFVQPFGSLTTVLQPDNLEGGALRISTCTHDPHAGNYLTFIRGGRGFTVKVPFLHEQLEVRAYADRPMDAVHRLWCFGVPYLTMRYTMTRSGASDATLAT